MLPHIYKDGGTIAISMPTGEMKMIDTAHKNYDEIVKAMKAGNDDKVIELINIAEQISRALKAQHNTDNITIKDSEVLFRGEPIHNTLTTRIINMIDEGFDVSHMILFLENLMQNPSYRAVNELYTFLEAGSIPITENGTFLSYKKISSDYKDIYTGTFNNSIGSVCKMDRNKVNEDSSQTCSHGLHVCSYDYLPSFGSASENRVVVCSINPRDVVSIPNDYNNTKMRVCEYVVVGEIDDYTESDVLSESSVMVTDEIPNSDEEVARHGKLIGKMVTSRLDNGELTNDSVFNALIDINVDSLDAVKMTDCDNKAIGKNIARAIRKREISGFPFEDALMAYYEDDISNADDLDDLDEFEEDKSFVIADRAKRVGKIITKHLDDGVLTRDSLYRPLQIAGNLGYIYADLIEGSNKQIGKNIAHAIKDGQVAMGVLDDEIMKYLSSETHGDFGDIEDVRCPRCGAIVDVEDGECSECGYLF